MEHYIFMEEYLSKVRRKRARHGSPFISLTHPQSRSLHSACTGQVTTPW
jgi:hypothetical protein